MPGRSHKFGVVMLRSVLTAFFVAMLGISLAGCILSCKASSTTKHEKMDISKTTFPETEFLRKGGVGEISDKVYVDLASSRNRLWLDRTSWEGLNSDQTQLVVLYGGKPYTESDLPSDFKLSGAVIVSFQKTRVYFYDYTTRDGGYYSR